MGCGSSSAAMSSYPGNQRVAQPVYAPNSNEYKQIDANTAVAQAHFVTCPGGNALRLMSGARQEENYIHPMEKVGAGAPPTSYISVTLPPGVSSGDVIHVKAPDGRLNAIVVPEGMGPGSNFTVEFANDSSVPPSNMAPGTFVPTVIAEPEVETGVPASYTNYSNGAVERAPPVAQPISAMQMNAAYAPK